jgi:predicted transposase/invertase (TIGR01784 family)
MVKSFYDPKVEERGIQKGIEEGKVQEKIETATEMIKEGESIEKIKKYTKLDENKILELIKQIGTGNVQ